MRGPLATTTRHGEERGRHPAINSSRRDRLLFLAMTGWRQLVGVYSHRRSGYMRSRRTPSGAEQPGRWFGGGGGPERQTGHHKQEAFRFGFGGRIQLAQSIRRL